MIFLKDFAKLWVNSNNNVLYVRYLIDFLQLSQTLAKRLVKKFVPLQSFRLSAESFILYTQKMKFSIKDLFSKCDQIRGKLRIWSHFLKKFLMENCIFLCSVISNPVTCDMRSFATTVHDCMLDMDLDLRCSGACKSAFCDLISMFWSCPILDRLS